VHEESNTSISELLFDKFGLTLELQRQELDPYVAEKIVGYSARRSMPILNNCSRWRSDDATLMALVEQQCLRQFPLNVLRGGGIIERYVDMAPRIRNRLWLIETENEGIFRGDALLGGKFKNLYEAVSVSQNIDAWRALLEDSAQMPWYVAPLMMQHLACRLCVLARIAFQRFDIESGLPTLFRHFIAWRDRVAPLCLAEGAFDMAARAYAAPLSVTCEPWRVRHACRDTVGLSMHVNELMYTAQAGISTLSPRYWHEILETLLSRTLPLSCDIQQTEWMNRFLRSPVAIARYPSTEFVRHLIVHAARIWASLPDRALGPKTRFTVFCERFDLVGAQCEQLLTAIVDNIGTRILAKVCTLDDALRDSGFRGDSKIARLVEHKAWHRALRIIAPNPDYARAQFVRSTRGSVFLRNQAAIFLAGTTGEAVLEPG